MDGNHGGGVEGIQSLDGEVSVPFSPPSLHQRHGRRISKKTEGKVGGLSKRLFDIAVSAGGLLVLSPVLVGILIAVRLESRGSGIFRQRRGGYQGRPFYILKFRTMRVCEETSISQAKEGDDRTTRIGRFLRRTSLDELPQLINVLLGEMSLIGPRPHALAHDRQFATFDRRYMGRYRARPGITGLAQVSGARGPTDTPEKIQQRMEFDLRYVSAWSWMMDASILARTVLVLLRDRSAF